jgi:ATP synthase protein I
LSKRHSKDRQPKNSEIIRAFAHFSHIGVTMAASVLVGVLLGKYLDGLFGASPWFLLVFSLLGAGAAIKALFNIPKDKK